MNNVNRARCGHRRHQHASCTACSTTSTSAPKPATTSCDRVHAGDARRHARLHRHAAAQRAGRLFARPSTRIPIQTTLLFDWNNVDGYSYDYRGDSRLPVITYGNVDVTNPATWTLSQIRLRPQSSTNEFRTASFELAWDVADAVTLKAGPQYKKFEFETELAAALERHADQPGSRHSGGRRGDADFRLQPRSYRSAATSMCPPAARAAG